MIHREMIVFSCRPGFWLRARCSPWSGCGTLDDGQFWICVRGGRWLWRGYIMYFCSDIPTLESWGLLLMNAGVICCCCYRYMLGAVGDC